GTDTRRQPATRSPRPATITTNSTHRPSALADPDKEEVPGSSPGRPTQVIGPIDPLGRAFSIPGLHAGTPRSSRSAHAFHAPRLCRASLTRPAERLVGAARPPVVR